MTKFKDSDDVGACRIHSNALHDALHDALNPLTSREPWRFMFAGVETFLRDFGRLPTSKTGDVGERLLGRWLERSTDPDDTRYRPDVAAWVNSHR